MCQSKMSLLGGMTCSDCLFFSQMTNFGSQFRGPGGPEGKKKPFFAFLTLFRFLFWFLFRGFFRIFSFVFAYLSVSVSISVSTGSGAAYASTQVQVGTNDVTGSYTGDHVGDHAGDHVGAVGAVGVVGTSSGGGTGATGAVSGGVIGAGASASAGAGASAGDDAGNDAGDRPKMQLIARYLGRIEKQSFTDRDLQLSYFYDLAMQIRRKEKRELKTPPLDISQKSSELLSQTEKLFLHHRVYLESQAVNFRVEEKKIRKRKQLLAYMWALYRQSPLWKKLKFEYKELSEFVFKRWRVEEFINFKKNSFFVFVQPDEVSHRLRKNPSLNPFHSAESSSLEKNLHEEILEGKREEKIQWWLGTLRKKYSSQKASFFYE